MYLLLLVFLNIAIIVAWFRDFRIYAGGDTGLPIYSPSIIWSIVQYAWWSGQGTGFSYPGVLSSLPYYSVLVLIEKIGFGPVGIQILFFSICLLLATFGMYFFVKNLSKSNRIAFFVTIFYIVNPYAMINIWHRGSYPGIEMMFIIPWTLYFIYKGLTQKRILYSSILAFFSIFFAHAFNAPAFIATWWFLILTFWVYLFFTSAKKRQEKKFYILFLFSFILLWLGFNLWWLIPFFHIAPTNLFVTTTQDGNIGSLRGVSEFFKLPFALRGVSTYYLHVEKAWGSIYSFPFFDILSFIELGFIIAGLFFWKKIKLFGFFLFLFIVTIFISKGSNSPFGSLLVLAFGYVSYLGVFRNPYEKFGILLPFIQAYLAGYGLVLLAKYMNNKFAQISIGFLLIGFFIYHWPFFSGHVFGNLKYPLTVKVPTEYDNARSFFEKSNSTNPRILHLPFALGDGIVYKWEYGYWGLEPSQLFFPGSSISHYLGLKFVDDRYKDIAFSVRSRDEKQFQSFISRFSINYVVFHKDVDFSLYRSDTSENIQSFLENQEFLKKVKQEGNLVYYKVENAPQNHVQATQIKNPTYLVGDLTYYPRVLQKVSESDIYLEDMAILPENSQVAVLPDKVLSPFSVEINEDIVVDEMPYARVLPGKILYPVVRAKERFEMLGREEFDIVLLQIQYSGKRLVEVSKLLEQGNTELAITILDDYEKQILALNDAYSKRVQSDINSYSSIELTVLQQVMMRQEELLRQLSAKTSGEVHAKVKKASKQLDNVLYESGIKGKFALAPSFEQRIYRFTLPQNSEYSMILGSEWDPFLLDKQNVTLFIDGEKQTRQLADYSDFMSIPLGDLKKGAHEIGIEFDTQNTYELDSTNEVGNVKAAFPLEEDETIQLKAEKDEKYIDLLVNDFNPSYRYLVSLDYWTKQGFNPGIAFIQDIDPVRKKEISLEETRPETYDFFWKNISSSIIPSPFTQSLKIRITLKPWNNCVEENKKDKTLCKNEGFYNAYNRLSDVMIKNIKISKFPPNEIYLSNSASTSATITPLSAQKLNETNYKITLSSQSASVLVLNQTFHDGWKLKNKDGVQTNAPHVLVNGYANGWTVKNPEEKYSIEFVSQKDKYTGMFIGGILVIIGFGLIYSTKIWTRKQK